MHQRQRTRRLAQRLLQTVLTACLCSTASSVIEARVVLVPEAPITLTRDVSIFEVDAPIEVFAGDMVSTSLKMGGAQLKDDSGTLAELGVGTRVAIGDGQPGSQRIGRPGSLRALSLLSGWIKVARTNAGAAYDPLRIDTPAVRLSFQHGSTVVRAMRAATSVYVETGMAEATMPDLPAAPEKLTADQFADREMGKNIKQAGRPSPEFVDQMPVNFRDPLRPLPHGPTRVLEPDQGRQVSYADISEWLTSSLPLRSTFVPRFGILLRSKPFRAQLQQRVKDLPEWKQVLYPKKPRKPSAIHPTTYAPAAKEAL